MERQQEEEEEEEAGELVTDILQRRLAEFSISDARPLRDLVAHLQAHNVRPDVLFHVRRTSSCAVDGNEAANVLRVLAHTSILRKESDYFREILQRHSNFIRPADNAPSSTRIRQDNVDHSLHQDFISYAEHSSQASDGSRSSEHDSVSAMAAHDDPMYIAPNSVDASTEMQEEPRNAHEATTTDLPNHSSAASRMNDILGREVLAHVQAQLMTRTCDSQVIRRPSDQDFYSCKASFLSVEGMDKKDNQSEGPLSDGESHSCKSSFVSADGMDMRDKQGVGQPSGQKDCSCKSSFLSADGAISGSGYQTPETASDGHSSSARSMSTSAILPLRSDGFSVSSMRASTPDLPFRRSICLGNVERKASVRGSMRKSVRFSLDPADIILPASLAATNIQRLEDEDRAKQSVAETPSKESVDSIEGSNSSNVIDSGSEITSAPAPQERIDKPMIRRRHTEVDIVMERGSAEIGNTKLSENEEDTTSAYRFKLYVVKKLTWTTSVLIGIMEWLYMGMCHINLEDLPGLYDAAYRAVITSLTWCIRRHSMPEYLHLALSNPLHCKHLLELCRAADCAELSSLQGFCEALLAVKGQPNSAILETKHLPGARTRNFLAEGFFVLDGHPLCVLKTSKTSEFESPRDLASNYEQVFVDQSEPPPVLIFARCLQPTSSSMFDQQRSLSNCESAQEQAWKVVLLDDDPAGSFYAFFRYASVCSLRSLSQQGGYSILKKLCRKQVEGVHVGLFKLQMITRFKVGSILVESLSKAIRQGIIVREKRGSGSFIKGPNYCSSLVIKGDPCKILMAAKAIPYDMVGRSALKIRAPCAKTFSSLFHASHTFGVDLHSQSIVLVKPLYVLIKVLEFLTKLNTDAYEAPSTERTFIEICQPTEPF